MKSKLIESKLRYSVNNIQHGLDRLMVEYLQKGWNTLVATNKQETIAYLIAYNMYPNFSPQDWNRIHKRSRTDASRVYSNWSEIKPSLKFNDMIQFALILQEAYEIISPLVDVEEQSNDISDTPESDKFITILDIRFAYLIGKLFPYGHIGWRPNL